MLHCNTDLTHEIPHRRIDRPVEPGRGLAALSVGRACAWVIAVLPLVWRGAAAAEPAIQLLGKGVQVYGCAKAGPSYAWHLIGPDATLTDAAGKVAGHHLAGPTWRANDGSAVVGSVLTTAPSPQKGSVPWLVLSAKSHAGAGRFADIAFVVRSQTEGGVAPALGCDEAREGVQVRVPYQATYLLFPAATH